MLKTSALKRSLLKMYYLQFDEVHWLMIDKLLLRFEPLASVICPSAINKE